MKKKKEKKLNAKLLKYLIGAMVWVAILMLVGTSLAGWDQYKKFYNEKSLQIARSVADQIDGDYIERLYTE